MASYVELTPRGRSLDGASTAPPVRTSCTALDHWSLAMHHAAHAVRILLCGPAVEHPSDHVIDTGVAKEVSIGYEDTEARRALLRGVFLPTDKWKESWDIAILVLILYSAVFVPYRICFSAPASGWVAVGEHVQTVMFIVDVCFNFNTAYAEGDAWVSSRPAIARKYLQGWFWIDFPSSIPFDAIDYVMVLGGGHPHSQLGLFRFLRLFRLLRLLQLLRLASLVADLEDRFEANLSFLRIVQLLAALVFLAHVLACFWWYVASLVGLDAATETWASGYADGYLLSAPPGTQYLASMYWALTTLTTVGYGDITPTNDAERGYAIFSLLMGALVFGYMLSSVAGLIAALDRQGGLAEERIDEVKEYLRWRNLPRELAARVRKYYDFYLDRRTAFDETAILDALTPNLRLEVVRHVLRDTLGRAPATSPRLR